MEVLNAHAYDWSKPPLGRKFLSKILGNGLVTIEGSEHKQQRKLVMPVFSGKIVRDLVPLFWSKSMALVAAVDRQRQLSPDSVVEISDVASRATLDIIGVACLGKDFSTLEHEDHELAQVYKSVTDPKEGVFTFLGLLGSTLAPWLVRWQPFPSIRRFDKATTNLHNVCARLLAEKSEVVKEETTDKDIMATLIRTAAFSDDSLKGHLLTFLAAGHETSATALTWALYMLSKHSDKQSKLRVACQDLKSHAGEMDAQTIDSIPYLDAVCNEVLRLFPPVTATSRVAVRDTQIGDTFVPKGTICVVVPWAIQRSADYWGPDAEVFLPSRWLGDNGKTGGAKDSTAFLTFLHGPRSCIGQNFARLEFKCLLAALVMNFELELRNAEEPVIATGTITIKPRNGLELIVRRYS
ncbi:hypothetical protein LTR62_004698 [Meristemomyces frigidus]|uniref:Cytochrome P450 n=1 Tax=Meristemomyces frigidus TaxID=1508187 RepID=A0AAN7YFY6_9PEZI|nr:hypothetical protein LTR62_004698 [Meristemomyces frigidus]